MEEQLISRSLEKYRKFNDFRVSEVLHDHSGFTIYDLEYDKDDGLHTLSAFAEGSFRIGKL